MNRSDPRSGRVELDNASHLVSLGSHTKSAGDSVRKREGGSSRPRAKRSYATQSRVDAIRSKLNDKQSAVIADVDRLGIVSGRQLQALHYGPSPAGARLARKHLGQLIEWQALIRMGRSVGGERAGSSGFVYCLGPVGQRLRYPGRFRYSPRWTPGPSFLRHAMAVSQLYVDLRQAEQDGGAEIISYDTEPHCWRRYFGPGGAPSMLKPDALAVIGVGDLEYRYFVEIDCSTEHRPHLLRKAKTYVRYFQSGREQAETGIFPYVIWSVPDDARAELMIDTLACLPAEHWRLFIVATTETAAESMSNPKEVT